MGRQGVYIIKQKNGHTLFRASLTFHRKHISLGSYPNEDKAHAAYLEARSILDSSDHSIFHYDEKKILPFEKYISLINLRDHGIYFANPIYLLKTHFLYYLSPDLVLKFDLEDLFYYSEHKIMRRQGHFFVADYGSQINIMSRYGIRNYAIPNHDFQFVNQDSTDFRYENIRIINPYYGVKTIQKKGQTWYRARIHIRSYYVIGTYSSLLEAAIAYNKAIDILTQNGFQKNYTINYIDEISPSEYADIYIRLKIAQKIYSLRPV